MYEVPIDNEPSEPAMTLIAGDLQQLFEMAQTLQDAKLEHFKFLLTALLDCYLKEETRATVIVANEAEGQTQIIPINANQEDVVGMIDFMVDAFSASRQSMSAGLLN